MQKKLFEGLTPREILDNLEAEAIGTEEKDYIKPLNDEEVATYNSLIVETNLKIRSKEEEKKEWMEQFKIDMDPLKKKLNSNLDIVKHKAIEKTGTLFVIPDHERKRVGYYDETGTLINERPMLPEERENIFPLNKAI